MATALSNMLAFIALDNTKYLKGLTETQQKTAIFMNNFANVGGAVALGALTIAATAVAAVGTAAWNAAETVDEAFDSIAVATGAQGTELKVLQDDWEAVFTAIPVDAGAAADAIGILNARLDVTGPALQNIAIPLLEVSRLLGTDVTQNAEEFTRVIGDWNIPVEDAAGSLDKLFLASQTTGADLNTLMQQVVQYGAPMRNFGFSFEESAGLLALFAAQGVNTEIVMSGLRIAQGKFIGQGKDMNTGLWETVDAIQNASSKTDALALATEIFGAKAAGDMVDAIRSGKFELDGLVDSMLNADGAIMDAASATSDWGETWKMFQNKMTVALAPLGEKLREGLGSAIDQLAEVFGRADVQDAIMQFSNAIVVGLSTAVEYIPVVIDGFFQFVDFLNANQGIVIGVLAALGIAALVWGVTTAAAALTAIAPMLPVIGVILLIAGAAYLLYEAWTNNWGGIQEKVGAVWAVLEPIFQNVWNWLSTNIPLALQTLSTFWTSVLLPAIQGVWVWLSTVLFPFFQALGNFFGAVFNVALTAMAGIWQNVLQPAIDSVIGKLKSDLMPVFLGLASFFQGTLQPIIQSVANWIGNQLVGSFNNLSSIIRGVTGILNGLASQLNNMSLPAWMTPGSPTPWEMGLWGVSEAMNDLSRMALPNLSASMSLAPVPAFAGSAGSAPSVGGGDSQNNSMIMEDMRRLLRELPDDLARAIASAIAKKRIN